KFGIASLAYRNPGGLEEWIVTKTNQMTNRITAKRTNPADIKSQGALNFDNAEVSTLATSTPVTPAVGKVVQDSVPLDSSEVRASTSNMRLLMA
ncbi:MAG: hypothetical protein Q9180_009019, partial [Flavoplaca navasiana]